MAIRVGDTFRRSFARLRIEPTPKRIRALIGDEVVVDSEAALLVWEPRRVVPTYAVPRADIRGPVADAPTTLRPPTVDFDRIPVWDPRVPFAVRETSGREVTIGGGQSVAGFVADDPDLADYVILDFGGFDEWLEEEDPIISHPHDPYSRIDIRTTSRNVQISLHDEVIAESDRARLLYETGLPVRFYLPREDVRAKLLPSERASQCAYKGAAKYYSPVVDGSAVRDLAWSYEQPLIDAREVQGYIAFFDERVDVSINGVVRPRPITPWS